MQNYSGVVSSSNSPRGSPSCKKNVQTGTVLYDTFCANGDGSVLHIPQRVFWDGSVLHNADEHRWKE